MTPRAPGSGNDYGLTADAAKGAPIPDETVEQWRTEVSFRQAGRALLSSLLHDFAVERGFFVVWGKRVGHARITERTSSARGAAEQPFHVEAAIDADGNDIEDPDFYLDRQRLRQLAATDGVDLLDGVAAGVPRPLLSCSFPLIEGERAILILEATPGSQAFHTSNAIEVLSQRLPSISSEFRRFRLVESQKGQLQDLENQLKAVQRQLKEMTERSEGEDRAAAVRVASPDVVRYHEMITRSPLMKETFAIIERIKDSDLRTLIVGETGTGKELVARAIHFGGHRATQPFEVIPCGSL